MRGAEGPPSQYKRIQHGRGGDDWLDELKTRSTYLKLWKDRTTYVIGSQAFVIEIMRGDLEHHRPSPCEMRGHGCKDQYTVRSEMKVNAGHVYRKSLACARMNVVLPVRIFQSEL